MSLVKVRSLLIAFCCAVFAVSAHEDARAFELFGVCFSGECKTQDNSEDFIDPKSYDVEFITDEETPEELTDALKANSELWRGKDAQIAGSAGLIARAKGDYRRILAGLYGEGRYAGAISIEVNGVQAADISTGEELPETSQVIISIAPGAVYHFGRADIENAAPFTDDPKDQIKTPEELGFASGEIAEAASVKRAKLASVKAWQQLGYPLAKVEDKSVTAVHPKNILNVLIRMAPGPKAYFGPVTVEGTDRMDPEFVAYMVGLEQGKEYDPDDIEKARKRLDRLGVFSSRKITEAKAVTSDGALPITVTTNERKLRRIGVGATVSSVDGAGLETFWLHRNLFGKAERLRLDGKVSGVGNTSDPEEYDYLFSATLTQPGKFSPDTDLIWNAFVQQEFNDTFKEKSGGGSVAVTNFYSDEITYTTGIFGKYGRFTDAFGERTFLTAGFDGEITYDSRKNKTDAKDGFYAQFKARPFYEFEYQNTAIRLETELRTYKALDKDKDSVIAGRVKVGSLLGASIAETPPDLLFNAGGGNSIRGFAFKGIGVPAPNGDISGGRSLIETSIEFRQRINQQFGVVGFIDAGTVNSESFIDFEEDLSVGVGLGVRYYTGLGPIRLDVAVPLDPGPDDPSFAFYAGIGQAF